MGIILPSSRQFIKEVTVSNAASLDITGLVGFSKFDIEVENVLPVTGTQINLLASNDGGSTFPVTNIYRNGAYRVNGGGGAAGGSATYSAAYILGFSLNAGVDYVEGVWRIRISASEARIYGNGIMTLSGNTYQQALLSGGNVNLSGVNALRLIANTGNISGTVKLYGVR